MTTFSLVVEKGRSKGKSLRLKPNGNSVVGREGGNQLVISDPQASRKHFQIEAKLGEFVLKDLGSSNGTFVNGQRIETAKLSEGDKIAIGDTLVYFLRETQDPEGAPRRGDLTGREVAGYRIGRLLGRGGMGTVYEAVQISLERKVAFKTLAPELTENPEFIERFISEARAAGRLSHANIVAVFDVGSEGDLYFYSMEYMAGGSVEDQLRLKKTLPFEETIPIIFDAARGLEYAEKHGLIHRDIKPDNLMLGADDVVKICDLGLATFSSRQHEVSGSPHYIAPEQALGKDIDHRADLYALGVSWYHLLCGETPFSGSSAQEIARKHVEEEAPSLAERAPEVPPEVVALVERLMAKDVDKRLSSARQLQADLAELARRYPIRETVLLRIDAVAPDEPPSEGLLEAVPAQGLSGHSLSWIALALLAVALLAGAFLITRGLMGKSQARKKWARERIQEITAMLNEDNLELAEESSKALVTRFEEEGLSEEAGQARELGEEAARRVKERKLSALEKDANAKLEQASQLFRDHGKGRPEDPSSAARLEQVQRLLDQIVKGFPETKSAEKAQTLRAEVTAELKKAQEAQRRLAERQAEAGRRLTRLKQGIDSLLEEEREGKYSAANERVKSFDQEFGDVLPTTAQELSEDIQARCRKEVGERAMRARQHVGRKEWAEAKTALLPVMPPLGFAKQEQRVQAVLRQLEETRGASSRLEQENEERADRVIRESARARIAEDCRERDYRRAVSTFRGEVVKLTTPHHTERARTRAVRLAGAARSLERLAEHVRSKKPGIEKVVEFKGGGEHRAPAVEVDFKGRRFTFQHKHFIQSLTVDTFTPAELLGFFEAIPLDPGGKLDLARLAYELGERRTAAQILSEVTALDPSLRRAADDLRVLDQE